MWIKISHLGSRFPGRTFSSCESGFDLWRPNNEIFKDDKIQVGLEAHDCSLIILECT